MNIIFFGTSDFSKPIFEALKKEGYSPILWGLENSFDDFKKLEPDICVVAAYGKIIPKEYLEIPKFGFLNVHPSLLPKYRGASPIQAVILNGDKETGVTIILMDEKVDHGPILEKSKIQNQSIQNNLSARPSSQPIESSSLNDKKYKELEKELAELGAQLLIETLPKWVNGEIKPKEQNHAEATYTKKFYWQDGKINWSKSAEEIDRQIRALNPEPGTWTIWNPSTHSTNAQGGERNRTTGSGQGKIFKILEALPLSEKNDSLEITRVFLTDEKEVAVKCGFNTVLSLKKIQLEGKEPIEIKDFLNGHRNFIGSTLTSNV